MRPKAATISSPPEDDSAVAARVAAGDQAAFALLMRRHNQSLYRTARSILRDDTEAEDALQEAYFRAFRAIGEYRGEAALSTWLGRIVINESIARLRRGRRFAEVIQLGDSMHGSGEEDEMDLNVAPAERPDETVARGQARRLLEAKIDALPDVFRTVFVMRSLQEMSVEETAACLGIAPATVRSRQFRARGMLREALSREIDFAFEEAFSFDGARCDRIVAGVLARLRPA